MEISGELIAAILESQPVSLGLHREMGSLGIGTTEFVLLRHLVVPILSVLLLDIQGCCSWMSWNRQTVVLVKQIAWSWSIKGWLSNPEYTAATEKQLTAS